MCPVAAESKNSKPSSKKKINKKINTNLETVVGEESNKNNQTLQTSAELNESNIENNNNEFSDSEEDKGPFIFFRITKFIIVIFNIAFV